MLELIIIVVGSITLNIANLNVQIQNYIVALNLIFKLHLKNNLKDCKFEILINSKSFSKLQI